MTALGYGVTDGINQTGTSLLRKSRMRISNAIFSRSEFETDGTFSGTCQGDSGGPAFFRVDDKHVLLGVTSRGDEGCGGAGVYTKVSFYTDWIKATIQEFSTSN